MRIYSWNVNGLRACGRKGFSDWLAESGGEIVCLQETRALPEQLDSALREPEGWDFHLHPAERKGYSGVGMYSQITPDRVETGLGVEEFDIEGRIQSAVFGALTIVNGYFPNGSGRNRDNSRIPYKLAFYRRLFEMLEAGRRRGDPILVLGDFNTAHEDIDLARPKANRETSGFRPEEREELDRWIRSGWTDTYRHFHPDTVGAYTWWSNRQGVRERNVGWRIDYVLASHGAMEFVRAAAIHSAVLGSDHCPISVDMDRRAMG